MPGPITPEEVAETKQQNIPEFVFEAFNEVIAKHYSSGYASFPQDEVVARILEK